MHPKLILLSRRRHQLEVTYLGSKQHKVYTFALQPSDLVCFHLLDGLEVVVRDNLSLLNAVLAAAYHKLLSLVVQNHLLVSRLSLFTGGFSLHYQATLDFMAVIGDILVAVLTLKLNWL